MVNSFDGSLAKKPDVNDITGAMKSLMGKLSSNNRSSANLSKMNSGELMATPPELSVDEEVKVKKIDSEVIKVPAPQVKNLDGEGASKSALLKKRQESSSVSKSGKEKSSRRHKKNKTSSSDDSSSSDSSSSGSSDDDSISVSHASAYKDKMKKSRTATA